MRKGVNNKDKELIEIPNNPVGIANNNTNIVVDNYSNDLAQKLYKNIYKNSFKRYGTFCKIYGMFIISVIMFSISHKFT